MSAWKDPTMVESRSVGRRHAHGDGGCGDMVCCNADVLIAQELYTITIIIIISTYSGFWVTRAQLSIP